MWNRCLNSFFPENRYSFRCFQSDEEFIPDPRRSDRESTFTLLRFPLLEWAESTVTELNNDSEVGRTICVRGPN